MRPVPTPMAAAAAPAVVASPVVTITPTAAGAGAADDARVNMLVKQVEELTGQCKRVRNGKSSLWCMLDLSHLCVWQANQETQEYRTKCSHLEQQLQETQRRLEAAEAENRRLTAQLSAAAVHPSPSHPLPGPPGLPPRTRGDSTLLDSTHLCILCCRCVTLLCVLYA